MESAIVGPFDGLVQRDLRLLDMLAEEVRAENRQQDQRAEQRAEERERHRVRHGPEQASRRPRQGVDRKVSRDDDRDRIEDRPLDVPGRVSDHFGHVELLAVTRGQLAEDVLDHDDRAVHDHAEINRADRQQVGRDMRPVETDERKEQREWNRDRNDEGGADAEQQQSEHHQHEHHAPDQVAFDRPRRFRDQIGPIVVRDDLDVRRKHAPVQRLGHLLDLLQHQLGLLSDAHEDDAFDGVGLTHEAELSEAGGVVDGRHRDILHVHRDAVVGRHDDVADVVEVPDEAEASNVVELSALRVEPATRVGVVVGELLGNLLHRHAVRRTAWPDRAGPDTASSCRRGRRDRRRPGSIGTSGSGPSPG